MSDRVADSQPSSPEENGEQTHSADGEGESSTPAPISSAQMENIFHRWYYVDAEFEHSFPDHFRVVPTANASDRLWRSGMNVKDVINRLLGKVDNDSHDNLIQPIMVYYNDVMETATNMFADLRRRFQLNKHHLEVLRKMKSNGKIPRYLTLETPRISSDLFSAEVAEELRTTYHASLKQASEALLDLTIEARVNTDAKLRQEADKLIEDVRISAMQKWMEAQHVGALEANYNRWDHVFPVYAVRDGTKLPVPLSAVIFRTAMKECQAKVSRLLEQDMQEKTEKTQARRRENDKRKEVLRAASSLPHREAEISLVKQMEKLIAPLAADVRKLKEQGNRHALDATGPPRAEERSGANARSGARSRPGQQSLGQRGAPQASATDPQRGRKNGAEMHDKSPASTTDPHRGRKERAEMQDKHAAKRDRPSPATLDAERNDARENESGAGTHKRRKRRRRGKGQAE
jgi:hypothetical protein